MATILGDAVIRLKLDVGAATKALDTAESPADSQAPGTQKAVPRLPGTPGASPQLVIPGKATPGSAGTPVEPAPSGTSSEGTPTRQVPGEGSSAQKGDDDKGSEGPRRKRKKRDERKAPSAPQRQAVIDGARRGARRGAGLAVDAIGAGRAASLGGRAAVAAAGGPAAIAGAIALAGAFLATRPGALAGIGTGIAAATGGSFGQVAQGAGAGAGQAVLTGYRKLGEVKNHVAAYPKAFGQVADYLMATKLLTGNTSAGTLFNGPRNFPGSEFSPQGVDLSVLMLASQSFKVNEALGNLDSLRQRTMDEARGSGVAQFGVEYAKFTMDAFRSSFGF